MGASSRVFERLSLAVLERGWLSSNNILFTGDPDAASIVDTGYATHSDQTVALISDRLKTRPLTRVVNTHLHSDHCGGNAALHRRWRCSISVPSGSFAAAAAWQDNELTFESTGQRCDPFPVHDALYAGTSLVLGRHTWELHSAPGHDPNAIMLFEPEERVLISGDALWRHGVSILFPEFYGGEGFAGAARALDTIERLAPSW
jgi:glyoxylase-like metal-dependent hydrolase (beta-lactamase superfamily II)